MKAACGELSAEREYFDLVQALFVCRVGRSAARRGKKADGLTGSDASGWVALQGSLACALHCLSSMPSAPQLPPAASLRRCTCIGCL
jgi:hypothetical protein